MSIEKVAKLAGVSTSTVSRVINKHPRVAPSTEKAVRSAMEQLDYTPSARRPGPKPASMSNIKTIGFFVIGKSDGNATPGFFDLLRGVSNAVGKTSHKLEFSAVPDPSVPPKPLSRGSIDAVVLHGIPPQGRFKELIDNLPTVWVMGNRQRPEKDDQIMPDTLAVGDIASHYLSDLGHERLAFLNLDAKHWGLASYGHCFVGVAESLGKSVVKLQRTRGAVPGDRSGFDPQTVDSIVDEFMELSPRPTGLFIGDAMMVAIFQPILLERGISFGPGQTQVITCNNEEAFLAGLNPRPAVIDISIEEIGRQGIEQLLWRMDNKSRTARVTSMIQPTLVTPDSLPKH